MINWFSEHPEFIALLIVVAGWLIARLLRHALSSVVPWINRQAARLESEGGVLVSPAFSRALQLVVYWGVLLTALLAGLYVLGSSELSRWLDRFFDVVPQILIALGILAAGHLLGLLARGVLAKYSPTAERQSIPMLAYAVIVGTAAITAIEQLGLDVSFLTHILLVVVTVFLAGLALAFALGAKTLVANLAAQGEILRYQIGDRLRIEDVEGVVVEMHRTGLVLSTEEGLATVPAHKFAANTVIEKRPEPAEDG